MRITDFQIHMWEDPKSGYPWEALYNLERLEKDMKDAQVDRAVLVPTRHGFGDDMVGVNDYCLATANADPHRFALMALLDPERPEAKATLASLMTQPGMKGLRMETTKVARFKGGVRVSNEVDISEFMKPGNEEAEWIWREAIRLGIPVAMLASRGTVNLLRPILEKYPDLCMILSHAGRPAPGPDPFADLDDVLAMKKYPNLIVAASSLPRYTKEPYPFSSLHEPIHRLYDTFGPQRLVWGSDYSTHSDRTTYRQVVDLFRVACDFIQPADLEWIMDKTLSRAMKWE